MSILLTPARIGSVELRTRALPGAPEKIRLQLQELRTGIDPADEGSSVFIVRPGESYVFERVPVGIDLLAFAVAGDGRDEKWPPLRLEGPTFQGERVVATVR